jgi:integrase
VGLFDFWGILGTMETMPRGRPKKQFLTPVFNEARGKWMLDIPAAMAGKRKKIFFSSQQEALVETAKIVQELSLGAEITPKAQSRNAKLSNLIAGYLSDRKGETSADNYTTLAWGLGILSDQYGATDPSELTPAVTAAWVKKLPYKTRGRFNVFAACRTFFNSPGMRDMVPNNPFRDAPPKKDKGHRLDILTPAQMKTLLALDLEPYFKAWLVCGGFSGMRSCEFERLSYESIDYDHDEIVIKKDQSKQGEATRPRSIPIYPAFKRHIPRGKGPLDGGASWKRVDIEMEKALKALGWKQWKKNCLRHSFASYALAASQDAVKTAYQMGHASPTLIYTTYGNAVSRADADAWWAL